MPSWKKLLVSGSEAAIPSVSTLADFTIDAGGDIILDADGTDIVLKDGGTEFGSFKRVSSDLVIKSATNDKDIVFKGVDNSTTITALTLDMSDGGKAVFGGDVSGSATSTGSFGLLQGDGSELTGISAGGFGYSNPISMSSDTSATAGNYTSIYGPMQVNSGITFTIPATAEVKIETF
tara:strand:+ start:10 stop:543 length:534 start_codon:yes stop_codon:yes gene_type:complete